MNQGRLKYAGVRLETPNLVHHNSILFLEASSYCFKIFLGIFERNYNKIK